MQAQMFSHKTTLIAVGCTAAVIAAALVFGWIAFAFIVTVALALATPVMAFWRRSATGVAGPEPEPDDPVLH